MSLKGYKKMLGYIKQDIKDMERFIDKEQYGELVYIINNMKDEIECIEEEMEEVNLHVEDLCMEIENMEIEIDNLEDKIRELEE